MEEKKKKHALYTAFHRSGTRMTRFGKCRCGAYLVGEEEIEQHIKEMEEDD